MKISHSANKILVSLGFCSYKYCFLFLQLPIAEKIKVIAQKVYGAKDIELSPAAQSQIDRYTRQVRTSMKYAIKCLLDETQETLGCKIFCNWSV